MLIFIGGIDKQFCVTEELAALKSLYGNTRGEDIFLQLLDVFNMYDLKWEKLKNVTTDGAKNMTGHNTGLVGIINKKLKELNITQPPLQLHCIIHQHALCAKVVNLKNVMICIFSSTYLCEQTFSRMNFIKSKYRTRLTDENLQNLLRISVSQTQPDRTIFKKKKRIEF